jgi:hypothetical protein
MFLSILRRMGSVIAGLILAFAVLVAAEAYSEFAYPFPTGYDPEDFQKVCAAHIAKIPTGVLAICTAIWALAPFSGSWLATLLGSARHVAHGYVVGAILLALAGMNMAMLPYPIWFPIVNLLTFPLGTYWGARIASRRTSNSAAASVLDHTGP